MKLITHFFILLFTLASTSLSLADIIYKSVDQQGKVTYSTTPPENSKQTSTVDIAPPPSEYRINEAKQRQQRNKEAADILDENRQKRDEMIAEENRKKRENQRQLQQKQQAEENNDNRDYGYPYYQKRVPGRPIVVPPVAVPMR